jgi:hypothetical protein
MDSKEKNQQEQKPVPALPTPQKAATFSASSLMQYRIPEPTSALLNSAMRGVRAVVSDFYNVINSYKFYIEII